MTPTQDPALYFPIERGLYEIGPGLKPFGFDFGNGRADGQIFQFDREFDRFHKEKTLARQEDLSKYFGTSRLEKGVLKAAVDFICRTAADEHPDFFQLQQNGLTQRLHCRLTGETLSFSESGDLLATSGQRLTPSYKHSFDALMTQFQEDAAILSVDSKEDWISAMHVCAPSHWDPREKLGRDFMSVHAPIPGFEKVGKARRQIVDAMVHKGPYVRFVWSFVTDSRLNHHPQPPPGENLNSWKGRSFEQRSDNSPPFYLRVERQLTVGLPNEGASLFFIRLSFIDGNRIRANEKWRTQLASALESMTSESRKYKGVAECFNELTAWLKT